jgi:hypothetical protein
MNQIVAARALGLDLLRAAHALLTHLPGAIATAIVFLETLPEPPKYFNWF